MILELTIRNIALIEQLTLSFGRGFNVLTGETGAGKSIIVDAMSLLLGGRGDREMIRHGAERAYVEALLDMPRGNTARLVGELGIETGDAQMTVSREMSVSGKNVCRINGALVNVSQLRQVMGGLVHLYGQNQQQQLLDERYHQAMLDAYAGEEVNALLQELGEAYRQFAQTRQRRQHLAEGLAERERRLDMLRYQIDEIERAAFSEGEEEQLEQERRRMHNAEKIAQALDGARQALSGEDAALTALSAAMRQLASVSTLDGRYEKLHGVVSDAYYALQEAGYDLDALADEVVYDSRRLDEIENRLALLAGLKRKYGADIAGILAYAEQARAEWETLFSAEETTEDLARLEETQYGEVRRLCAALTVARKSAAERFAGELIAQLADLGMKDAAFEVEFLPKEPAEDGQEEISFLISVNRGEPLRHLSKVTSGGEASRIMLAMQNISARQDEVAAMIFDEIDAGISGTTARVVATKIARISRERQVICVTHLPQIAAMGDVHFCISKETVGGRTLTGVTQLQNGQIAGEIARLSGGIQSELSLAHARELLRGAEAEKGRLRQG